jgi:SNF2 family DNA or RNA helicase
VDRAVTPTPYRLAAVPGYLIAQGPEKLLRSLAHLPGAAKLGPDLLSIPADRAAFMAVEAVAAPAGVSPEYRQARQMHMAPQSALFTHTRACLMDEVDLLPHQWEFLAFARYKHAVLNASEQGTGKTRSAWALWRLWQPQRTVIVCPKSLVHQWQDEFYQMWRPEARYGHGGCMPAHSIQLLGDGPVEARRKALRAGMVKEGHAWDDYPDITILNYEVLVQLLPDLLRLAPGMLIFDESWRIKNPKAAVTKAALKLCAPQPKIALLTGTPVGNDVGDLWSQLKCLGDAVMPDDYWEFMRRYASMRLQKIGPRSVWKPTGLADPAGLMRVLEPVWYRATKETCLTLPPKRYRTVSLALPPATLALYERVASNGCAELGAPLNLDGEQVTLIRLQQIAGGHRPVPVDPRGKEWRQEPLPCPKIDWLEQFARDVLLGNRTARALVWCRFLPEIHRVADALRHLGVNVAVAHGEVDNETLEAIKASHFSRDPAGVQVVVCQYRKMAFGHNHLQHTDTSIHFSHTWSFVERMQAEDRAHRQGMDTGVEYIDLVAAKTIDAEITQALRRKEDFARRLSPETAAG